MSFEVESTFWVWPNSMQEMLDVMYILKKGMLIFKWCYMIMLIFGNLADLEIS